MADVIHVASVVSILAMLTIGLSLMLGPTRILGLLMVAKRRELGLWFLSGVFARTTDILNTELLYVFARVANAVVGVLVASMIVVALWRRRNEGR